jgi:hypothetical protein
LRQQCSVPLVWVAVLQLLSLGWPRPASGSSKLFSPTQPGEDHSAAALMIENQPPCLLPELNPANSPSTVPYRRPDAAWTGSPIVHSQLLTCGGRWPLLALHPFYVCSQWLLLKKPSLEPIYQRVVRSSSPSLHSARASTRAP